MELGFHVMPSRSRPHYVNITTRVLLLQVPDISNIFLITIFLKIISFITTGQILRFLEENKRQ